MNFLYHRMINLLACDKLAVVEAQTVVQQQLDVGNDEFTRMLIYRMLSSCLIIESTSRKMFTSAADRM